MFKGFPPESTLFLKRLGRHNDRAWFAEHRREYERALLEPMRELVRDLAGLMLVIDPEFIVQPAVGKTISRINRDTRFSKDKSPYRDTMWLAFKQASENWQDLPGYFFEIGPAVYRYGMGFYSAAPRTMRAFRAALDRRPGDFRRAIAFYARQRALKLEGETYARALKTAETRNLGAWYQKRNLYLMAVKNNGRRLHSPALVDELRSAFSLCAPLYHFLLKVKRQADEEEEE